MSLFYRVLYSSDHVTDWNAGRRTSFHHATVGDWTEEWNRTQSQDPDDYLLVTISGTYTENALKYFLTTALRERKTTGWSSEDVKRSSELDGLCAFETPRGLVEWWYENEQRPPYPPVVIEFEGTYTCKAPDNASAVVARFGREVRRWMSMESFEQCFP